ATSMEKQASPLAHHLYQAGTASDAEKTMHYLLLAADQARAAAAHEEALSLLDNALSLWEADKGCQVADLHARRAAALRSLGRTGEAIDAYERAIALYDSAGELERMAANASELGFLHVWSYNTDKAVRVVDRVLKRVEDVMPAAECRLLLAKVGA